MIRISTCKDQDNRKSTFPDLSSGKGTLVIIEQTRDSSIYTRLLVNKT